MSRGLSRWGLLLVLIVAGCSAAAPPSAPSFASNSPAASSPAPTGAPSAPSASEPAGQIQASIEFTEETDGAAEKLVVAADGDVLEVTATDGSVFALEIPPGALLEDTTIRLTPLADVRGVADSAAHAVKLEPEGLQLLGFARLTITPSTEIPIGDQVMFTGTGEGDQVIAALVDPVSEPIVILLDHFSVAGAGYVAGQAQWLIGQAQTAQARISHQVGQILQNERARQLAGENRPLPLDELERLLAEVDRDVLGPLREAALLTCDGVRAYFQAILSLERQRQLLGLGADTTYAQAMDEAIRVVESSFELCEREAIEKCRAKPDPAILVAFWLGWDRMRSLLGLEVLQPDISALPDRATRICGGFGLEFSGEGFSLRTPQVGTNTVLDIAGRVDGCPKPDGTIELTGDATLDYISDVVADRQEMLRLFDALGGQPADAFEMELSQADTRENHLLLYPPGGNWSRITFENARGPAPSATLTFYNGLDEHVGDFPLAVVPVDPECEG